MIEPDLVTGLVAQIPLNNSANDVVSQTTGIMHHVTSVSNRHGSPGMAMSFSAADSSTIDFGDLPLVSFDATAQFTISCWVKVADTLSNMAILSKRDLTGPFEYCIDNHFNHNSFALDNWIGSGATSVYGLDPLKAVAPITPGVWQNLVYVADGNKLSLYVNGVLQSGTDQRNSGINFSNTSAQFVLGTGGGYGRNYYFNGAIDDVFIFNRALPLNAVQRLAQQ